ncbi:MAG TPA: hypothetical protein PK043_16715 [Alicycliphilus sp.]|nr:hypothetical protein [Alicycliphilus sp.]HRP20742.1 hypothetical protein [Alicycliphilus sp.]
MTGLLQRLAARATGSAWALQSDARLPFAGVTSSPSGATFLAPGTATAAHPPPMPAGAIRPHVTRPAPAPPVGTQLHPANMATDRPQPASTRVPADRAPLPQQRPSGLAASVATAALAQAAPHATPPNTPPSAATANVPTPWAVPLAVHADPPPLLPLNADRNTANTPAASSPPLGKAQPQVAAAPHALRGLAQLSAHAPPRSEPPEVHIHIGRIEVTAAVTPEPQAPRRPARERTQPLSLDAYLAQRKGRS